MEQYWSVEQCRWVPSPVTEQAEAEPVVPAPREAEETELVSQS